MSTRARIFAAVTLTFACFASPAAMAQTQNLEAGKSASQLFAGGCNACHKSPRGLLKTVAPGALAGFLREHYTTGGEMASQLASYLISNGASDTRPAKPGADKQGADKQGVTDPTERQGRKNRNAPPQDAARPDDAPPAGEGARPSRRRLGRTGEPPSSEEAKPAANNPTPSAVEGGPDGRKLSTKQRRRDRPNVEEPSMVNTPAKGEPAADDKPKAETSAPIGNGGAKPETDNKPGNDVKSEPVRPAAKIEQPQDAPSGDKALSGDKPVARRDPVPAVAPASPATSMPATSMPAPAPAVASGGVSSEPAAPVQKPSAPAAPVPESPPATASAPPPAGGPPAPPISR